MKRTLQVLVVVLVAAGFASQATAAECVGVSMPDTKTVNGQKLVLNGLGIREATVMQVDVYVAGLYLKEKSSDGFAIAGADDTTQLVLEFVRDVEKKKVVDAYKESFKKSGKRSELDSEIDKFMGWMGDVKEGDVQTYTWVPGKGMVVEFNGKKKGTIKSGSFAQIFFLIWLGDSPPNKGLKRGLLGGECG